MDGGDNIIDSIRKNSDRIFVQIFKYPPFQHDLGHQQYYYYRMKMLLLKMPRAGILLGEINLFGMKVIFFFDFMQYSSLKIANIGQTVIISQSGPLFPLLN